MDSFLLCDEVWVSDDNPAAVSNSCSDNGNYPFYTTKEDCEQAITLCLEKESCSVPEPGYLDSLHSKNLIHFRFRAIRWLIKSRRRLNLSFESVFNAANYLDRFISMNQRHDWKLWMMELLSVASLSVASKFTETSPPSLHEIQIEDLDYSFQSSTIRQMELILLQVLGWRLACVTTYSYIDLLILSIDSLEPDHHMELSSRMTELLLGVTLDFELLQFPPSVVALSALWCCLEELTVPSIHSYLAHITRLFNIQNQKLEEDLIKCQRIMKSRLLDHSTDPTASGQPQLQLQANYYWLSSPVTVLLRERIDIYDNQVDLTIFNINLNSFKKRRKN